jgi:SAM-dependent methyltransferase
MAAIYDDIGRTYAGTRQPDPRIAAAIDAALRGCLSVLNVGAGTGSYEPTSGQVVAVEPAWTMIRQRGKTAAPVIQARAEQLPFADRSFDAVLGVLTLHHWADLPRGLAECRRVAAERVAFFTFDAEVGARFWLFDYFPEIAAIDRRIFPSMEVLARHLGEVTVIPVPIPADCVDGFGGAYWKRPSAYLDPTVRAGMSTFSRIEHVTIGLRRLQEDLQSDRWIECHRSLLDLDELDLGYRLVVAQGC